MLTHAMASPTLAENSIIATVCWISGELFATVDVESSWLSMQLRLLLERSLPKDQMLKLMISDGRLFDDFETLQDHGILEGPINLTAVVSHVTLAELKLAGRSAGDLKHRGYTFLDLKAVGYSLMDLIEAGASVEQCKRLGFQSGHLKAAGFTAIDLREAGFSIRELLVFDGLELLRAGITPQDAGNKSLCVFREAGVTAEELREWEFAASSLLNAGYSFEELRHAGYPDSELLKCSRHQSSYYHLLRCGGFSAADMLRAGYNAAELEQIGYSLEEVMKVGPEASALRKAGFSAAALERAGFSADDMAAAGYSAHEVRGADCFGFIAQPIEYSSLQSLLHNSGEGQGSIKRRVENLLLLSPLERSQLLEQAASNSFTNNLRQAEKRAHAARRSLEKRQIHKRPPVRSKVHKRRQYLSDFSL